MVDSASSAEDDWPSCQLSSPRIGRPPGLVDPHPDRGYRPGSAAARVPPSLTDRELFYPDIERAAKARDPDLAELIIRY